jgi:hypothetical protein
MDKRKVGLIALLGTLGAALVWGGYATWDDWSGFVMAMFGQFGAA